jgi:Holliday junction resolvasome RuvABC endonuclease subunit
MSTICLGLDIQLTRVGYGVCRATDGSPVDCGCIVALSRSSPGDHLAQIFVDLDWQYRPHRIIAVYVEAPHVGLDRRLAVEHAMVIGRALQQAERTWPDAAVELVPPQVWKKRVGLAGNAKKDQVAVWARAAGFDHASQDALDAAGIATAAHLLNAEVVRIAGA